jgi:uncharacterized protein YxjI
MDKFIVGNDSQTTNQSDANLEGQEQQVNAGAIRKSTTSSILNALSNASGQQFESVESALSFLARTTAQQNNVGNVQPVEKQTTQSTQGRVTNTDLHEQFNKLQSDLARKDQALRERDLDSDIQRAMGDKFDPDMIDYALQKVKNNIQWNNDGSYAIMNSKGQERYGMDGSPLTIQGLVQEVASGNPKLLKQSNSNSGSGLRPGQGNFAGAPQDSVPDYSKDPAAFNQWATRNGLGRNVGLKGTTVSATQSTSSQRIL